ncbi:MAG: hypothetical protein AAF171_05225 [Cyanobacteria bacterium P01_A01_bin.116]
MFFSLLAGLVIAFALQLLLTNLGVALGLSAVGWLLPSETKEASHKSSQGTKVRKEAAEHEAAEPEKSEQGDTDRQSIKENEESGFSAPPVTHFLGLGVTLSLAPVLFAAAFLATEFNQFTSPGRGLIFGTILWSSYLLIITWLSSKTVSGIAETVLGGAAAGIRQLFLTAKRTVSSETIDPEAASLSDTDKLQLITRELADAIATQQIPPELLAQRREHLVEKISTQAELAPQQAESVVDDLSTLSDSAEVAVSAIAEPPYWKKLIRLGLSQLDLNDWDLETAWRALQTLQGVQETAQDVLPFNIISLDVETYLSDIPQWVLGSELLESEFVERLYDPEAHPAFVQQQLKSLTPENFNHWLKQRGDLPDEAVDAITDTLSEIHHGVLQKVEEKAQNKAEVIKDSAPVVSASAGERSLQAVKKEGAAVTLLEQPTIAEKIAENPKEASLSPTLTRGLLTAEQKLIAYFRYTTLDKLTEESVAEKLKAQLAESNLLTASGVFKFSAEDSSPIVNELLAKLNAVIEKRKGITPTQNTLLQSALRSHWESYYSTPPAALDLETHSNTHPNTRSEENEQAFYDTLARYFNDIKWPDVSFEDLQPDILQYLKKSLETSPSLPSAIDESMLAKALHLPKETAEDISQWLQKNKHQWSKHPRRWAQRAALAHGHNNRSTEEAIKQQDIKEQLTTQLTQYLQHQKKRDLTPASILKEVSHIVKTTAQSASAPIREQPSLSADFWHSAIAHRPDLSEADKQLITGRLTTAWQAASGSITAWNQEAQSAATTLKQLVSGDVLGDVLKDGKDGLQDSLGHTLSTALDTVDTAVEDTLESAYEKVSDAITLAKTKIQTQTDAAKQELQQQAENLRHQAAIAAWWLFISLLTAEIAAASAGWLAVQHPIG